MKKVLLSAALLAATCASAQITSTATSWEVDFAGFSDESIAAVGWSPGCDGDNTEKTYSSSIANGALEVVTTGEQEAWEKIEIAITDADGFPLDGGVDLSAAIDRGIEVELESSIANFEFMVLLGDETSLHCDNDKAWPVVADEVPALRAQVAASGVSKIWSNRNDDLSLNDESEGGYSWQVFQTTDMNACYPVGGQFVDSSAVTRVWLYFRNPGEGTNGCDGDAGKSVAGTFKVKSISLGALAPEPLQATVTTSETVKHKIDFAGKEGDAYTLVSNSRYTDCTNDPTIKAQQVKAGALEFITSGDQEQWHHAEMKIVDASGKPTTIDLSDENHQFIQFDLESDVDVEEFMILFADDNTKNCYKSPIEQVAADNNPAIKGSLTAGANTINNDNDDINGNNFGLGGFDWKVFQTPCMVEEGCGAGQYLDSTKVSEIWIYARKTVAEPSVCVIDEPTENCGKSVAATIKIKSIVIGDKRDIVGLQEFVSNEASFSVFPNPVTEGVINFSTTVEEVELYNIQGNLVKTGSNTDQLSVNGLEAGIYVIQSTQGYKRVVIK